MIAIARVNLLSVPGVCGHALVIPSSEYPVTLASILKEGASRPEDWATYVHKRDFTPTLIHQGFLRETSLPRPLLAQIVYAMDESLFRAYGFEPPE